MKTTHSLHAARTNLASPWGNLDCLRQQGSGTYNQGLAGPVGLQRAEGLNNVAVFYAIVVVT